MRTCPTRTAVQKLSAGRGYLSKVSPTMTYVAG